MDNHHTNSGTSEIVIIMLLAIVLIGSALWIGNKLIHPSKWQISYLPDANAPAEISSTHYSSRTDCLEALHTGNWPQGECGKGCQLSDNGPLAVYICQETAQ